MTYEEAIEEIEKWLEGCPFAYTQAAFRLAINALRKAIIQEESLKKEVKKNETDN